MICQKNGNWCQLTVNTVRPTFKYSSIQEGIDNTINQGEVTLFSKLKYSSIQGDIDNIIHQGEITLFSMLYKSVQDT